MMTSRPSRLTSAFSPLEVFLVSLFLQLPLAHPFGPVGQILQGPLIPLGVLQSLQKGQGQGRVGDGSQGYYALTQGRAQFLFGKGNHRQLLAGAGHKVPGPAQRPVGSVLGNEQEPGMAGSAAAPADSSPISIRPAFLARDR